MMKKLLFTLLTLVGLFANAQQSYYNDVNLSLTGTALRDALATKITNTHTNTLSYTPGIWEACKATDVNPNNSSEITLLYGWENGSDGDFTNDLYRDITLQDTGSAGAYWNREHTYAKSLGTPDLGTTGPGADAHHLRAADKNRNSARGSLKFVDGSGNSGSVSGGWYPGDQWKGDVARMMMYMYLRYGSQCLPTNVGVGTANTVDNNMIDLFLEWNAADPVSDVEDARNDYHENTSNTYAQGNRNPFIDNPNLATQIWGGPVAQNRWGSSDTEAPTIPTNVNTSSITSNSVTVTWTASTDNVAVTSYEVFVDGVSNKTTSTTSTDITGLNPSTTYTFTVRALDAAGNPSNQSAGAMATTLSGGGASGTCASETFDNIPAVNSSYTTRTWTGDDGFSWEATDARTDQTLNGKAITVRNGVITSAQVANGIGSFTVKTKRVFTGSNGTFDLNVNAQTPNPKPQTPNPKPQKPSQKLFKTVKRDP